MIRRSLLPSLALLSLAYACAEPQPQRQTWAFDVPETAGMRWYKGNTHTHTLESDGDSPPEYVARWYKEHGYDFLVLSDHNVLTDPGPLAHLVDGSFLLIPGEEVTSGFQGKAVHVNGLDIHEVLPPQDDSTLVGTIQRNVDVIREAEGIPHINHPNYLWSLGLEDLAQVQRYNLLEIFNGHPDVHNEGGGDSPGMEEVWDGLLSRGMRVYGIAVDDAHHFQGEFSPSRINPGRGWVVVRARTLDGREIVRNLDQGLFYASTGVELDDVVVSLAELEVRIHQAGDFKYRTTFIGDGGRVLMETGENPASFTLSDLPPSQTLTYVRARVTDSGGAVAWVQPVFVEMR
jgi:hypothetical protein